MQRSPPVVQGVQLLGQIPERRELATGEGNRNSPLDRRRAVERREHGIPTAGAGVLHGSAVAVGDLTVLQLEQDGHGLGRLPDRDETRSHRCPVVGEAVATAPVADRGLVVGEEAATNGHGEHADDPHAARTPTAAAAWTPRCAPASPPRQPGSHAPRGR